jgi:outer membrane protein assembly factor BamA
MRYVLGLLLLGCVAIAARQALVMRSAGAAATELFPSTREPEPTPSLDAAQADVIRSVHFLGQRAIRDNLLEQQLRSAVGSVLEPAALAADLERLAATFMDRGYRNVVIGTPQTVRGADGVHLQIPVEAGGRYTIGTIRFVGPVADALPEVATVVTLRPDQIASRTRMVATIESLTTYLESLGVKKVDIQPTVVEHPDTLLVDLTLHIDGKVPRTLAGR